MLRRLIGPGIEMSFAGGTGNVKADSGQLQQVLMNLVVNARDAMRDGGRIDIAIADVTMDASQAALHPGCVPGDYVVLTVRDTGCGMDAATRARVFEPFFTTKAKGEGTGLGLSTVYGIVTQAGGFIDLESEPGRGTTFSVYLPRTAEAPSAVPTGTDGPAVARTAPMTVVVVEDESAVREFVCRIMARAGHDVYGAAGSAEALEYVRHHSGPIGLFVIDVMLPGMCGPLLTDLIKESQPDARVLYMSGYSPQAIAQRGLALRDTPFLQKPFTPDQLFAGVHAATTSSQSSSAAA